MCFLFSSDDVYHSEDDPPPFHENQDFDFGLDNKSIRRAFIRKVRRQCGWKHTITRTVFFCFFKWSSSTKVTLCTFAGFVNKSHPFEIVFPLKPHKFQKNEQHNNILILRCWYLIVQWQKMLSMLFALKSFYAKAAQSSKFTAVTQKV